MVIYFDNTHFTQAGATYFGNKHRQLISDALELIQE